MITSTKPKKFHSFITIPSSGQKRGYERELRHHTSKLKPIKSLRKELSREHKHFILGTKGKLCCFCVIGDGGFLAVGWTEEGERTKLVGENF
jgi:hypothetical protein